MEKIAFIICYKDESKLQECIYYINRQIVPNVFKIELIPVSEAESLAEGYQAAMKESDAKYKVYMQENVLLVRNDFVLTLIEVFDESDEIGMFGFVGNDKFLKNASYPIRWSNMNAIYFTANNVMSRFVGFEEGEEKKKYTVCPAYVLDGMLLATQHDLDWDTENDLGDDFCSISQCERFRQAGYEIKVVGDRKPFVLHDTGARLPIYFDKYRKNFCEAYREFGYEYDDDLVEGFEAYEKLVEAKKQFLLDEAGIRQEAIEKGYPTQAGEILSRVKEMLKIDVPDTDLYYYLSLIDAYAADMDSMGYSNLWPCGELEESLVLFKNIIYLLWRACFGCPEEDWESLVEAVSNGLISNEAVSGISKLCTGRELEDNPQENE